VNPFQIALLALVSTLAVIAVVGLRFPRGRAEWPLEARQTAGLIVSGLTAVTLFALLYVVTRDVRWPGIATIAFGAVALTLGLLLGVALFLPQGLRARP
jgi:uncharacterized BrkB/YihY/UPF0761 family membrane protein